MPFDYFEHNLVHFVHPKIEKLVEICLELKPAKRPSFKKIVGLLACMLEDAENGIIDMGVPASHGNVESLNPLYGILANNSRRISQRFSRRFSRRQSHARGNQARRNSDSSRRATAMEKASAKKTRRKDKKDIEIITH